MSESERAPDGKRISKNPYAKDEKDPRWRAVEIRREYERRGYDIQPGTGGGVFDKKTGKKVV